jgi:hypothetical protein
MTPNPLIELHRDDLEAEAIKPTPDVLATLDQLCREGDGEITCEAAQEIRALRARIAELESINAMLLKDQCRRLNGQTPTPEQIEAAAMAIYKGTYNNTWANCIELAQASLTAAAGVGELPSVNFDKEGKPYRYCPECGRQDNLLDDRTIERCARVADHHAEIHSNPDLIYLARHIAAAIRALKDVSPSPDAPEK